MTNMQELGLLRPDAEPDQNEISVDYDSLTFDEHTEEEEFIPEHITDEEPKEEAKPMVRTVDGITVEPTDDLSNADAYDETIVYELAFQFTLQEKGMNNSQIEYMCEKAYTDPSIVKRYYPDMVVYHPTVRPEIEAQLQPATVATDEAAQAPSASVPTSTTPNTPGTDDDDIDIKNITSSDTLLEALTKGYIKEHPVTVPELLASDAVGRHIRDEILTLYRMNRALINTNLPKGDNIEVRRRLNGTSAAQILLSTGDVRVMYIGTEGSRLIMKRYYRNADTDWKFKWTGTWQVLSSEVGDTHPLMKIFRVLCPNSEKTEKNNYLAKLCDAEEAVFCEDNRVVFFRNGVWNYKDRSFTSYDDPDFDKKVRAVALHKLPVYHPLGNGAILKPHTLPGADDLVLDEPVYHNDNDNFDWSPSQLLTDPFDMTTEVGRACNLILWQCMQFLIRHMSGGDGWYHFWINMRGEGRNCKGTLWDMMRRLIEKKFEIEGDEDLDRTEGLTVPMSIENLGKDFNLASFILNAWAIVGEETNSATQMNVDDVGIIKNLARNNPITYRPIREAAFKFAFQGFLCQQSNKVPRFQEKNDSVSTHAIVIPFDRSFKDNAKTYIKKDYVLREETAEWLVWMLTVEMDTLTDYDADALKVLEPFKREMMKASMNTVQFFDEILPMINLNKCIPAEFLYNLYRHWCDKRGVQGRSVVTFKAFQDDMEQYGISNDHDVEFTIKGKRFAKTEIANWIDALVEFGGRTSGNMESEYRHNRAATDYTHRSEWLGRLEPTMFGEYDKNGNLTKGKIFSRGCFVRKTPYDQMQYNIVVEDED